MSDGDDTHRDEPRARRMRGPAAVAAVVVLAVVAGSVASCGDRGVAFWRQGGNAAANACPRPASFTGSEFNAQEAGLRALRRAAFRGDFFAQLELGQRYAAARATDK
ncbi:MAG TPA: sel1 repeat family protein, partial [Brevundimonas sp.]